MSARKHRTLGYRGYLGMCDFREFREFRDFLEIRVFDLAGDKGPTSSSCVCSCHFRDGKKVNLPTVFKRNAGKIFEEQEPVKRKPKATTKVLQENSPTQVQVPNHCTDDANNFDRPTRPDEKVLLQIELDSVKRELEKERAGNLYHRERHSVKGLSDDVVRMETGLPNKQIFKIVVAYVRRFEDFLNYFAGWKVDCLALEDQIFMALMKVRQNYTNLHLAQLFNCSTATVRNIVLTFINVLYSLLYEDCMRTIPSREKNETSLPGSFVFFWKLQNDYRLHRH